MKYLIATLLILSSSLVLAKAKKGDRFGQNPSYTIVKTSDENGQRGTLLFDAKSCQFKIFRQNVYVSVVDNNFLIELPDKRTVVGSVNETDDSKSKPACFHSLTDKPADKKGEEWMVFASNTDLGTETNGLENCKNRTPGAAVTDSIKYLPQKEYQLNCSKDGGCRATERVIRIKAGVGLTFYIDSTKEKGSNLRRDALNFDESYRSKCETQAAPNPPKKTRAKSRRTT